MAAYDATVQSLKEGDAEGFLLLAGRDAEGGIHQWTDAAAWALSGALTELSKLELKGNQRKFASETAILYSEDAVSKVRQIFRVVDLAQTGLVRGISAEYDAVKEDASAIDRIKDDSP